MMKRMRCLRDKCVLVTGAAGGIGSELARQLLFREGARLILVDKDLEGLEKLKGELEKDSAAGSVQIFEADLASRASIQEFCEKIEGREIDVLVNNAGIVYSGTFVEMDLDDFEKVVDVNLYAAVRLTHHLLPKLIRNHGFIANVGSAAGLLGPGGLNAYATSKFGLVGFSESLRVELRGKVGVSVVCSCLASTPIAKNTLLPPGIDPREREEQLQEIDRWVQRVGLSSPRVARAIIKSIKRDKGLVLVGFRARFLWGLKRWAPPLAQLVRHLVFRWLLKRGYVREARAESVTHK